jgi:hypothetical protein
MKLSRSEFLVLREILRSEERGVSYNVLLKTLRNRLSNQGLSDALKGLQVKSLIFRDFMSKTKGSHAVYRSTRSSFEAVYANDVAEFLVSEGVTTSGVSLPSSKFETGSLYPHVSLVSEVREEFAPLKENKDLGVKLRGVAQHVASAWVEYKQNHCNEHSLEVVKEYEQALAEYLWLFECQTKRWAPGAANDLKAGRYNFLDPLDMVENAGNIDHPLRKYQIDEEHLEWRRKSFPNADDKLSRTSVEELQKLKSVVYDKEKKRTYEEYLKSLIPPKTVLLMDFRLSTESAWKHFTGEVESRDYVGGEPESFAGIISRSAFGEAMRAYGRKEPEPGPEPGHDRLEEGVRPENHPKWIF